MNSPGWGSGCESCALLLAPADDREQDAPRTAFRLSRVQMNSYLLDKYGDRDCVLFLTDADQHLRPDLGPRGHVRLRTATLPFDRAVWQWPARYFGLPYLRSAPVKTSGNASSRLGSQLLRVL